MGAEAPVVADATSCEATVQVLYQRRSQQMFGFARRLGLSDEDASDAVQEAMLRLVRELGRGTALADPDAWAFRVLYRLVMDRHRLRRRVEGLTDRLAAVGVWRRQDDGNPERRLETDSVWRAVDLLPARQRAVVYLRYRADMSYDRIGIALGISPGAARGHASTGLATLRRRLGEEQEDE